jgi:hypothetical protein
LSHFHSLKFLDIGGNRQAPRHARAAAGARSAATRQGGHGVMPQRVSTRTGHEKVSGPDRCDDGFDTRLGLVIEAVRLRHEAASVGEKR